MGGFDYGALAQQVEDLRQQLALNAQLLARPALRLEDQGFRDITIDLSNADLAGNGLTLSVAGFQVSYLRRPSAPGGLLQVTPGGMDKPFGPGDEFTASFSTLTLRLAPGSAANGVAVLRVALNPQIRFTQSPVDGITISPTALLGTLSVDGVVGFAALQLEDLIPSGASPAGSFTISGWKKILVLIDTTSNAGTATSFDLVPYYQAPPASAASFWFEQGTERVSVPDTAVSGGQYRVVCIDLSQAQGKVYLAIQNLLAAARTGLNLCVLGIL